MKTKIQNKDLRALLGQAERRGCTVEETGGGHYRVIYRGRVAAIAARRNNDHRGLMNLRAQLRRAGVALR